MLHLPIWILGAAVDGEAVKTIIILPMLVSQV
jgi:hypothetical protein